MVVEEARRSGVRYLTLYAFSSENWSRPETEVKALMKLFERYLESELETLLKNGVRLRAIGDIDRLPPFVQKVLTRRQEETQEMDGMDLILAVSYGGRDEIVRGIRKIAERVNSGEIAPEEIDIATVSQSLDAPDVPDPDLLIRTSSENRISNFLLWQIAYSEICVVPELWPDFSVECFHRCLQDYSARVRRFGLTDQQLQEGAPGEVS
jgi:undecaprenyl diphosphate synthase